VKTCDTSVQGDTVTLSSTVDYKSLNYFYLKNQHKIQEIIGLSYIDIKYETS